MQQALQSLLRRRSRKGSRASSTVKDGSPTHSEDSRIPPQHQPPGPQLQPNSPTGDQSIPLKVKRRISPPGSLENDSWRISANNLADKALDTEEVTENKPQVTQINEIHVICSPEASEEVLMNVTSESNSELSEIYLTQLTMLEAFGVKVDVSALLSTSTPSVDNSRSSISRNSSTSETVPSARGRRRHSMIGSMLNPLIEMTAQEKEIDRMMKISMTQEGIKTGNTLERNRKEYKGILKNSDDSPFIAPQRNRRMSLQVGNESALSNILANLGAPSRSPESTQSIMAAFAGLTDEKDLETLDADLSEETAKFEAILKKEMKSRSFKAGEFILRKHDMGYEMFLLTSGKVEILSGDGRKRFSTVLPGSFFGEMGVLFRIPRTASARALENSICKVLDRAQVLEIVGKFPAVEKRFKKIALSRMKEVQAQRKKAKSVRISISDERIINDTVVE